VIARRGIGLVIVAVAALVALVVWIGVSLAVPVVPNPRQGTVGSLRVVFDTYGPSVAQILVATGGILALAAGVTFVESKIATRYRRSDDEDATPLSPRVVMGHTRGVYAGPVTITVLVPAHNEESVLPVSLPALMSQSRPPDRVIVVADNCTDRTVEVARNLGAWVVESVGNTKKKAGALNQALKMLLPTLGDNDTIMVADADTALDDGFLAEAERRFTVDRGLMAIGGLFYGEEGHGLLGLFQRNEYTRYSRDVKRRRGQVFVLTGTASVFRSRALRTVAEHRGTTIPGVAGDVYDTSALTEDNELTIALKSLGALMISPSGCTVVTELMPAWKNLWVQRLRWQRGALENVGAYGLTRATLRYWAQQLGLAYGVVALTAYVTAALLLALAVDRWVWLPFWLALGQVFVVERVVTVWAGGVRARVVAAVLLPELVYAFFLNMVFVRAVWDISAGREAEWKHVVPKTAPTVGPAAVPATVARVPQPRSAPAARPVPTQTAMPIPTQPAMPVPTQTAMPVPTQTPRPRPVGVPASLQPVVPHRVPPAGVPHQRDRAGAPQPGRSRS